MRTKAILVTVAMFVATTMFAQEPTKVDQRNARLDKATTAETIQKRTNRKAKELMIPESQKAAFTTVYSRYLKEKADVRESNLSLNMAVKEMNEEEFKNFMQKKLTAKAECANIDLKYYSEFRDMLTKKQLRAIYNNPKQKKGAKPAEQPKQ